MSETLMYAYDKITNKTYRVGYIDFAKQKCQLAYFYNGKCYVTYDRKLKDVMLLKDSKYYIKDNVVVKFETYDDFVEFIEFMYSKNISWYNDEHVSYHFGVNIRICSEYMCKTSDDGVEFSEFKTLYMNHDNFSE